MDQTKLAAVVAALSTMPRALADGRSDGLKKSAYLIKEAAAIIEKLPAPVEAFAFVNDDGRFAAHVNGTPMLWSLAGPRLRERPIGFIRVRVVPIRAESASLSRKLRQLELACDRADARPGNSVPVELIPGEIIATTDELRFLIARLREAGVPIRGGRGRGKAPKGGGA